ncbi:hypothetical protein BD410DRAFT_803833 [Rickenella mellea]|uniref:Uncharacterized protein n=1 Tax=Rickenella mellea TaxID=50990 RepID=A0A4Y7Q3Q4_9AGAM|nr:hypothetical protein BD410DRAFT_803833 [Rickenella mellea]
MSMTHTTSDPFNIYHRNTSSYEPFLEDLGQEYVLFPILPNSPNHTLRQVVAFLCTLALPATHPSHLTAPGIFATLKDAQRGYADMGESWSRKRLDTEWSRTESITSYPNPPLPGSSIITTFAILITPLGTLFSSPLSSLRRTENELKEGLHGLRGDCLCNFLEILVDIKLTTAPKAGVEIGVGMAGIAFSVNISIFLILLRDMLLMHGLKHLKAIPDVQDGCCVSFANAWRWGPEDGREDASLEGFLNSMKAMNKSFWSTTFASPTLHGTSNVVTSVLSILATLSRSQMRSKFGAVRLENNASFLDTHTLLPQRAGYFGSAHTSPRRRTQRARRRKQGRVEGEVF